MKGLINHFMNMSIPCIEIVFRRDIDVLFTVIKSNMKSESENCDIKGCNSIHSQLLIGKPNLFSVKPAILLIFEKKSNK